MHRLKVALLLGLGCLAPATAATAQENAAPVIQGRYEVDKSGALVLYPDAAASVRLSRLEAQPPAMQGAASEGEFVTVGRARIRAEPSLKAAVVEVVPAETTLTAIAGSDARWVRVGREGRPVGYVARSIVSPKTR